MEREKSKKKLIKNFQWKYEETQKKIEKYSNDRS